MTTTAYCTDEEAVAAIFGPTGTSKPEQLTLVQIAVKAACRQIDNYCDRPDGFGLAAAATARVYVPESRMYVFTDDIGDASSVIVSTDENNDGLYEILWRGTTPFPQYLLEPVNAPSKWEGRPYVAVRAILDRIFPPNYGFGYFRAGGKLIQTGDMNILPQGVTTTNATVQVTAKWGWPAVPSPIHDAAIQQAIYLYKSFSAPFGTVGAGDTGEIRMMGEKLHPAARSLCNDYRRNAGGAS